MKQNRQSVGQNRRPGYSQAVIAVAQGSLPLHLTLWGSCFRPIGVLLQM
jgi:hypothetical protein